MIRKASVALAISLALMVIGAAPAVAHSPHVDVSMAVDVTAQVRLGCVNWTATVNAPAGGFNFDFVDVELHFPTFTEHGLQASSETPWMCPDPPQTGQFEQGTTPSDGNPATDDPHGQAGCTFQSALPGVGPAILPAGGSLQCFFSVRVTADAPIGTILFNHAHVTAQARPNSQGQDGVSTHDTNEVSTIVVGTADLGVTKSGPASVSPGGTVNYTIVVSNQAGRDPAVNTVLSDSLPASLTGVTISGGGCTSFPCNVGTLNGGQSVTVQVSGTASGCTDLSNTATASSQTPEPNPDPTSNSGTANTNVVCTDLSLSKTAPSSASSGVPFNYTLTATNNGPDAATGVTITDPLPSGVTFNSASSGCTNNSGTVTCSIGNLANGASATKTINVTATAPGTITNTATVSSTTSDPNSGNNTASATTSVGRLTVAFHVLSGTINRTATSNKQGTFVAWIETTPTFNSLTIASICVGSADNPQGGDCNPTGITFNDRDTDGDLDWSAKFVAKKLNVSTGDAVQVCGEGTTSGGVAFRGCDTVRVI